MMDDKTIEHDGKIFEKTDYQEKLVKDRRFTDCTFKNCRLNGTQFINCYFTDCIFEDCDLSMIKVKGSFFNRVEFNRCKAIGINWFEAGNPFGVQFTACNISYASFFGKAIKKPGFVKCTAKDADFTECSLPQADFGGADLEGAHFGNTDLTGANFNDARNYYINLLNNKVAGAKFSLPEALSLLQPFEIVIE